MHPFIENKLKCLTWHSENLDDLRAGSDEPLVINPKTFEGDSVSWGAENIVRDMVTSLGDRYRVLAMGRGQGSIGTCLRV